MVQNWEMDWWSKRRNRWRRRSKGWEERVRSKVIEREIEIKKIEWKWRTNARRGVEQELDQILGLNRSARLNGDI